MPITVDDILKNPFLHRPREERLMIVSEVKPKPYLNMAAVVTVKSETDGGMLKTHQFSPTMYDDFPWLTGCEKRNAFFCWPCLLFKSPIDLWNSTGVTEIAYLSVNSPKHEESVDHIQATLEFQKCLEETKQPSNIDFTEYNELVRRNREILRRLTDVICNLLIKEQHFYERKNGCQLNPEAIVKNLLFLRTYDVLNCNYIEDAVDLIKISPNVVNDLVDTIAKIVKLAVRKEVLTSTYVSLILSDHSKISSKAQVSTVLRYIKDGKVYERFIGFLNMGDQKTVAQVSQHITNTLCEFGILDKLLAVSFDGGILPSTAVNVSNSESQADNIIEAMYPNAFFVPWYCHSVDHVLQQSLMNIKECSLFLKAMNEMKNFFNKKSNRYKSLETFMASNLPATKNSKWFVRSQFIQTVHKYRKYFILFFESVLQNSPVWETDDVNKALGFQQILEEFQTVFLLHALTKLFDMISSLSKTLKSSVPDDIIANAAQNIGYLCNERDNGFADLWSEIHSEQCLDLPEPAVKKIKPDMDDPKIPEYLELYKSIILCLVREIDLRFVKLAKLSFCQLLSCDKHGNYMFSHEHLKTLGELRGGAFDEDQVRNELIVMRTNGKIFSQKTIYELYDFLLEMKLKSGFKGLFRLCEFILTLPFRPPSKELDVSKFEEIKDWSYISNVIGVQTGDVSIPCVEIDYLQELKKSSSFHNEVAEIFYDANKTFELIPK